MVDQPRFAYLVYASEPMMTLKFPYLVGVLEAHELTREQQRLLESGIFLPEPELPALQKMIDAKQITPKEASMLRVLMRNPGRMVLTNVLLASIGDEYSSIQAVRVVVSRIRAKLPKEWTLESIPGFGYKLVVPKEEQDGRD